MDPKACARSKRASSQRGRSRHARPLHQRKQQSAPEGSKQLRPASTSSEPTLPCNWNRYEGPLASDGGVAAATAGMVRSGGEHPAVESKGAEYGVLLSQAAELATGTSSMLFSRGVDLLGWNVFADDDASDGDSYADKDSILSLDLAFLGRKLGQLGLAERLLIDPSLLYAEQEERLTQIEGGELESEETGLFPLKENSTCLRNNAIPETSVFGQNVSDLISTGQSFTTLPSGTALQDQVNDFETSESTKAGVEKIESRKIIAKAAEDDLESSTLLPFHAYQLASTVSNLEEVLPSDFIVERDTVAQDLVLGLESTFKGFQLGAEVSMKTGVHADENTQNRNFEPKTAEEELDALLDMLDNPGHLNSVPSHSWSTGGEVFSSLSENPVPSDSGKFVFLHSGGFSGIPLNEGFHTTRDADSWKCGEERHMLYDGKEPSNLCKDFDEWFDSLNVERTISGESHSG